jgi:hypothetical protein
MYSTVQAIWQSLDDEKWYTKRKRHLKNSSYIYSPGTDKIFQHIHPGVWWLNERRGSSQLTANLLLGCHLGWHLAVG